MTVHVQSLEMCFAVPQTMATKTFEKVALKTPNTQNQSHTHTPIPQHIMASGSGVRQRYLQVGDICGVREFVQYLKVEVELTLPKRRAHDEPSFQRSGSGLAILWLMSLFDVSCYF